MGHPPRAPFLLESRPVCFEQCRVPAGRNERAQRRLAEVMDEGVLSADDAQASVAHPQRVVVVLEHRNLEPLVEVTHLAPQVTPQRSAEQGGDGDVGAGTRAVLRPALAELDQPAVRRVGHRDLGLGGGAVAHRAGDADRHVAKVDDQARDGARGHDRVVVEDHQGLPGCRRHSLVDRMREALHPLPATFVKSRIVAG